MGNTIEKDIYRLLKAAEKVDEYPELTLSDISAEELGMTPERWTQCLAMLTEEKYVTGISVYKNVIGERRVKETTGFRITLAGVEYLRENNAMRKIAQAAKGIIEVIG